MNKGSLLIVDDNEEILIALKLFLNEYFTITTEKNPNKIPSLLREKAFDLYILDMNFSAGKNSGNEGLFWMQEILKHDQEAIIIFITAYGDVELSVKAMKLGATDFIQKPWEDEKLLATVQSAYKLRKSRVEIKQLKEKNELISRSNIIESSMIIGQSKTMAGIMETIKKVAQTDANILILGENGTGKELIANEIHRQSNRNDEVFIKVDVAALTESLFESELFGYKKGSFTDAKEDRMGRFEAASGGTLFLDEIGNINMNQQSKLLAVLQNKQIIRLGENLPRDINIRLIAATNKNLQQMVSDHEFRDDLLYRINTIQIEIPALRERLEDLPIFLDVFLKKYSEKYQKPLLKTNKQTIKYLQNYHWPGNIREFEHLVEKAVIMEDASIFNFSLRTGIYVKENQSLNLEDNQKNLILRAINKVNGNYSAAAEELGISRKTLYNKLKKYEL